MEMDSLWLTACHPSSFVRLVDSPAGERSSIPPRLTELPQILIQQKPGPRAGPSVVFQCRTKSPALEAQRSKVFGAHFGSLNKHVSTEAVKKMNVEQENHCSCKQASFKATGCKSCKKAIATGGTATVSKAAGACRHLCWRIYVCIFVLYVASREKGADNMVFSQTARMSKSPVLVRRSPL